MHFLNNHFYRRKYLILGILILAVSDIAQGNAQSIQKELEKKQHTDSLTPSPVHTQKPFMVSRQGSGVPLSMLPRKEKTVVNLKPDPEFNRRTSITAGSIVPAGTYAPAILLGGVDASTSINAQNDPRPVLLRIIDHARGPMGLTVDLEGCKVVASSYGDLASERAYIRLEKLTCIKPLTGEIIETPVTGVVVGEDGIVGMRGRVVKHKSDTSGNGLFSSEDNGLPSLIMSFESSNSQESGPALEEFVEYYIKRAEQLQPVILIENGRRVDVVFTKSINMDTTSIK